MKAVAKKDAIQHPITHFFLTDGLERVLANLLSDHGFGQPKRLVTRQLGGTHVRGIFTNTPYMGVIFNQ
jgi:hypothetical protein